LGDEDLFVSELTKTIDATQEIVDGCVLTLDRAAKLARCMREYGSALKTAHALTGEKVDGWVIRAEELATRLERECDLVIAAARPNIVKAMHQVIADINLVTKNELAAAEAVDADVKKRREGEKNARAKKLAKRAKKRGAADWTANVPTLTITPKVTAVVGKRRDVHGKVLVESVYTTGQLAVRANDILHTLSLLGDAGVELANTFTTNGRDTVVHLNDMMRDFATDETKQWDTRDCLMKFLYDRDSSIVGESTYKLWFTATAAVNQYSRRGEDVPKDVYKGQIDRLFKEMCDTNGTIGTFYLQGTLSQNPTTKEKRNAISFSRKSARTMHVAAVALMNDVNNLLVMKVGFDAASLSATSVDGVKLFGKSQDLFVAAGLDDDAVCSFNDAHAELEGAVIEAQNTLFPNVLDDWTRNFPTVREDATYFMENVTKLADDAMKKRAAKNKSRRRVTSDEDEPDDKASTYHLPPFTRFAELVRVPGTPAEDDSGTQVVVAPYDEVFYAEDPVSGRVTTYRGDEARAQRAREEAMADELSNAIYGYTDKHDEGIARFFNDKATRVHAEKFRRDRLKEEADENARKADVWKKTKEAMEGKVESSSSTDDSGGQSESTSSTDDSGGQPESAAPPQKKPRAPPAASATRRGQEPPLASSDIGTAPMTAEKRPDDGATQQKRKKTRYIGTVPTTAEGKRDLDAMERMTNDKERVFDNREAESDYKDAREDERKKDKHALEFEAEMERKNAELDATFVQDGLDPETRAKQHLIGMLVALRVDKEASGTTLYVTEASVLYSRISAVLPQSEIAELMASRDKNRWAEAWKPTQVRKETEESDDILTWIEIDRDSDLAAWNFGRLYGMLTMYPPKQNAVVASIIATSVPKWVVLRLTGALTMAQNAKRGASGPPDARMAFSIVWDEFFLKTWATERPDNPIVPGDDVGSSEDDGEGLFVAADPDFDLYSAMTEEELLELDKVADEKRAKDKQAKGRREERKWYSPEQLAQEKAEAEEAEATRIAALSEDARAEEHKKKRRAEEKARRARLTPEEKAAEDAATNEAVRLKKLADGEQKLAAKRLRDAETAKKKAETVKKAVEKEKEKMKKEEERMKKDAEKEEEKMKKAAEKQAAWDALTPEQQKQKTRQAENRKARTERDRVRREGLSPEERIREDDENARKKAVKAGVKEKEVRETETSTNEDYENAKRKRGKEEEGYTPDPKRERPK
jgi:hypothetical protein